MTAAPVADLLPVSPDDQPVAAALEGVAVTFSPSVLARARRWATFSPASDVLLDPHGHFAPQPRDQMSVSVHLYAVTRRHLDGIRPDEGAVMARMLTLTQVGTQAAQRPNDPELPPPAAAGTDDRPDTNGPPDMNDLLGRLG